MTRPPLPLPPLIATLRESAASTRAATAATERLGRDLGRVARATGLAGLRLELLDADPLPPLVAGWGSLAASVAHAQAVELPAADGGTLARVWTDGPTAGAEEATSSLGAAVEAARAHLRADRANEHLAALDAALRGIGGALAVDAVLQLIVDRVRVLADAQYAALGIVGEDGRISQFLTSGMDPATRRRIGALPRGHGLLGLLIGQGKSIRIPDIETDPRRYGFPPNHPPMHSFLGVPVLVRGASVGNLYLTNKRGRPQFSAADQELVERFALHAGIAIQDARLAAQVQQLLLIEERERIGADLHDGVIQRIYGVNLSLDEVPELVHDQPDEAARRVEQAIEALNATIGEIREFIYILRPPGETGGLAPSLQALAAEVHMQTGLNAQVASDDVPAMSPDRVRELLSIVREALSNAARHAAAERASVTVGIEEGSLRIDVVDDGKGFEPDARRDEGHHGLVNMRRRAERLGGTLQVVSRSGAGTRIIVMLPMSR